MLKYLEKLEVPAENRGRRVASVLVLALAVFLAAPSFLFQNNRHDIQLDFGQLCAFAAASILIVALSAYLLLSVVSRFYSAAWIVAGLGLYVAVKFFLWPTYVPLLDGTEVFAGIGTWRGILSVGSALLVGALCVGAARYVSTSALGMIAFVLAAIGLQPLLQPKNWTFKVPSTDTAKSEFVRFSREGDVLMVVLDTVQSDVALEVLEENPDLAREWVGFDYFWNHIGKAPTTLMSMLPIYSGKEYAGGSVSKQYAGLKTDSVFSDGVAAGYDLQVIVPTFFECFVEKCLSRDELLPSTELQALVTEYMQLVDLALLRVLPTPVHHYWYNSSNGRLQKLVQFGPSGFQEQSAAALETLAESMEAQDRGAQFKALHIMGAHPPIVLDEDCSLIRVKKRTRDAYKALVTCNIRRFTDVLRALKQIGVYDRTTIVVMADHGETVEPPKDPSKLFFDTAPTLAGRLGRFAPMFAIKRKDQTHAFRLNNAPTATSDLRATLCAHAFKCPDDVAGANVFELDAAASRERSFIDFLLHQADHRKLDGMPKEAYARFSGTGRLVDFKYDQSLLPDRVRAMNAK